MTGEKKDSERIQAMEKMARDIDKRRPREPTETLPAVPKTYTKAWEIIQSDITQEDKLKALRLWMAGDTMGDAAKESGIHRRDLWNLIQRFGLTKVRYTTESLMGMHKIAAHLALELIITRMAECPEEFKTKDLAVVAGISSDKLGAYEGWSRGGMKPGDDYGTGLKLFGDELAKSLERGGTVKMELTVKKENEPIDVTPIPDPE